MIRAIPFLRLAGTVLLQAVDPSPAPLESAWADASGGGAVPIVHLGQPARLRLTFAPPGACTPGALRIADAGGPGFVLRGVEEIRPPAGAPADGTRRLEIEVVPFALGELEFPGVIVPWVCPEGTRPESRTGPLRLTVESTVAEPSTAEPADIRGSARLLGPQAPPWLLGAAVVLALAGTAAWWRARPAGPPPPAPPVDPFEGLAPAAWARHALDRLAADQVLERAGVGPYHDRLAGIVRAYVRGVFGVETRERTTSEILEDLSRRAIPSREARSDLRRVLGACDLVKFARAAPAGAGSEALRQEALRFVAATQPGPAAEGSA